MRRKYGITLVELLVVLGIVALVAAIVVPTFLHASERGRQTTCASNLRQLGVAIQQYVADSDGRLPAFTSPPALPRGYEYVYPSGWESAIRPYVGSVEIYRCPDVPREQLLAATYPGLYYRTPMPYVSYEYNVERLFQEQLNLVRGRMESEIALPSLVWLNADSRIGIAPSYADSMLVNTPCGLKRFAGTLHHGGANYSYLDGHVRWRSPAQFGADECALGPYPAPFGDRA